MEKGVKVEKSLDKNYSFELDVFYEKYNENFWEWVIGSFFGNRFFPFHKELSSAKYYLSWYAPQNMWMVTSNTERISGEVIPFPKDYLKEIHEIFKTTQDEEDN